ncbi:hypothetical protein C8J57DRAFT_1500266 [Mycena rebaudengoi]|nr:hypothetical protein C8J57DRAFT_1500266 [Mycena rebaudengoi]
MDEPVQMGLVRLPSGSERVTDAEEEVFLLYSTARPEPRGLGYLDSRSDTLTLSFELKSPPPSKPASASRRKPANRPAPDKTVEIQLAQDKTALRSRPGDTGSVVWKARQSHQHRFSAIPFFNNTTLNLQILSWICKTSPNAHVLELGSGTGLLSVALAPLVGQYTATDIEELQTGHFAFGIQRLLFPPPSPPVDLVLLVDCIYHPALLAPLLSTVDYVSSPNSTVVLVAMELRAEDVTREFLERWLLLGDGEWDIWRVSDAYREQLAAGKPYVVWAGMKRGERM